MNLGGWNEGPFGECRKVEARAGGERQVTSEGVQLPPRKPADPAEAGRAAPATLPFQEPAWAQPPGAREGGAHRWPALRAGGAASGEARRGGQVLAPGRGGPRRGGAGALTRCRSPPRREAGSQPCSARGPPGRPAVRSPRRPLAGTSVAPPREPGCSAAAHVMPLRAGQSRRGHAPPPAPCLVLAAKPPRSDLRPGYCWG